MSQTFLGVVIILTSWAAFGALHSGLARSGVKRLFEARFGTSALSGLYRPLYSVVSMVGFAGLWGLPLYLEGDALLFRIPGAFKLFLFLMKGIGLALFIGVFSELRISEYLGIAQFQRWLRGGTASIQSGSSDGQPLVQAHEPLVHSGVYLFVRNPMVLGVLLWFWMQPDYTIFNLVFNLGLTLYAAIAVRFEEQDLLGRYGNAYARYKEVVPSFLGGPYGLAARREALEV